MGDTNLEVIFKLSVKELQDLPIFVHVTENLLSLMFSWWRRCEVGLLGCNMRGLVGRYPHNVTSQNNNIGKKSLLLYSVIT